MHENVPAADFGRSKLKTLVLAADLAYDIPEVQTYARAAFALWRATGTIDAAEREFVFGAVASADRFERADFDAMLAEVRNPSTSDAHEITLGVLGHTGDLSVVADLLDALLDPNTVPVMDAHFLAVNLTRNPHMREAFWRFFRDNYAALHRTM